MAVDAERAGHTPVAQPLEGAVHLMLALRVIWAASPPPVKAIAWAVTAFIIGVIFRVAEVADIEPWSNAVSVVVEHALDDR